MIKSNSTGEVNFLSHIISVMYLSDIRVIGAVRKSKVPWMALLFVG